ncbi:MAG: BatD family protein, partial [Candidatus Omnitrophica bacterium]|nr:BatD family protein [Candidatus Omnitrophota bacterium]
MNMYFNIRRAMKVFVVLLGFLFLTVSRGFAQDISIEVELSSKRIPLGSTAQLTITVNGSQDVDPAQLPKTEEFDINYVGPSTRVSIVNGQYSSSKAFIYSLFPLKVGQFEVPAFDIIIAGKTYNVAPIPIEVINMGDQSVPGTEKKGGIEERIFLRLEAPKREVYLNERLIIKTLLFVSDFSVNEVQYPKFDNVGFSVGNQAEPRQYQNIMDGVRYS